MVVVVVATGGSVVVVGDSAVVVAGAGATVEAVGASVGSLGSVVVVVLDAADVDTPGSDVDTGVNVVGAPRATGASTTRSRIPATAADAISTESAVAPSHAAAMPK